jgi:hypothetical protein
VTTRTAPPHTGPDAKAVDVLIENARALATIDNPPVNAPAVNVRKGLVQALKLVNEAGCETAAPEAQSPRSWKTAGAFRG